MSFPARPSGAFSLATSAASGAVGSAVQPAASAAGLGNFVKEVDHSGTEKRRLRAFALKDTASKILQNQPDKLAKLAVRVSHCRRVARSEMVSLERAGDRARFDGLKTCNSVWCCAICSARISAGRRDELNALLAGARAEKLAVVMLTLTASHKRGMNLAAWLEGFKQANKRLRQRREWRAMKGRFVGSVVATEVTYSDRAHFHPHQHCVMVFDCGEAEALSLVEGLRDAWLSSLAAYGLSCNRHGFQVQPASAVGEYVAKFGAAEALEVQRSEGAAAELTGALSKQGREGGLTPWQLLELAGDKSDPKAGRYAAIWAEFATAFLGRRQLVWSHGLKARFGVAEIEDDAISEPPEMLRAWGGRSDEWKAARRRYVALLRAAEAGADLDIAEFGWTDSERWFAQASGPVIEIEVRDDRSETNE